MNSRSITKNQQTYTNKGEDMPYSGQRWLVEERDACGVGFIASQAGIATHELIEQSLIALTCLEHRGACSADRDSGDGAGLMTAIPWQLFQSWFAGQGIAMPPKEQLAVGMIFLPQDEARANQSREMIEQILGQEGLTLLGWRVVPVNEAILGIQAKENEPKIEQVIVTSPHKQGDELERSLYKVRRKIGKILKSDKGLNWPDELYTCSFSSRTIVYKGMVRSAVLGEFYKDLKNPDYQSVFAIYHRRFSTNTMPKWPLAQPMRVLGHNGEINTLLGNINWMMAREADLQHPIWNQTNNQQPTTNNNLDELKPIVNPENSDSATLDNVFELLVRSGRSPMEALMIMVPEAYQNQPDLQDHPEIVDFYEYYSGIQEAWDGPALLAFSDGKVVGATLDRNGLRPARYSITKDGYVVVSSEAGVVDLPEAEIIEKGRLGPGQMIAVDLENHEILKNWDIKQRVAGKQPYGEWLKQHRINFNSQPFLDTPKLDSSQLLRQQMAFGYTAEDIDMIIEPMTIDGKEPTFCMGDDIPLAVLSDKPRLLYDYFKQRFAQVTNPPIDPLRESLVMSLRVQLGERGNILEAKPEYARLLKLESPVLNEAELDGVKASGIETAELSTLFEIATGPQGLEAAISKLCAGAEAAVNHGKKILILSDRVGGTVDGNYSYIPPMLAVGAVHHHLIRQGLRMKASLVVDTAQCWSTHHFACLLGYGASAICPYLVWESVRQWWNSARTQKLIQNGKLGNITIQDAQKNYRKATEAGLLKILSKMGISLLSSYQGAQIFEAIGIGGELLNIGFVGTASRLGGLTIAELAQETISFHQRAFPELTAKKLENFGFIQYRPGGEYHMNSPEMAKALHKAVASFTNGKSSGASTTNNGQQTTNNGQQTTEKTAYDHYQVYKKLLEERPVTALRDLLDFNSDRKSIPVEEVQSIEEIVKRFCTGAMSLGSLSREAHETLAIAMNRLGGKSNSGEGGEDPVRFKILNDVDETGHSPTLPHLKGLQNGDTASSAIKQIASGRFGVTPEYLMSGKQLEIKIAQGAKPGEGGQLPGTKVSPYIGMLRRSKPGVSLISPPPHHDIYSIEDLAQLIFDLHQINPKAQVSVKLVAEIGIGTVAAGVAKANADIIQISGHDGGTGASPLSSIKHAGGPWELGVTEVHRVLMENQLRDRVLLRADGGFKTGWDVVIAALMGAEEYGFGSVSMIAEGCIMARICHTNNCPVGVATQQEHLRKRFSGVPGNVVNFFYFIAQEVRSLLAHLGYSKLEDIIGRADLLKPREGVKLTKTSALNVNCLIQLPDAKNNRSFLEHDGVHSNGVVLDDQILADPDIQAAIRNQGSVTKDIDIVNTDRTMGARIAGAIASQYGNTGFEGQITLNVKGAAGQSFGAFNLPGMTLILTGEANDYVGKGIHGGEIIIKPPADATYDPAKNVIVGNTCLYGATGGILFANGGAGERFGVRNSKAQAVIEGAGDHCCEYMTGGVIVVLGNVGRNVGAGMTGGLAYFLDEDGSFPAKVNPEIVKMQRVIAPAGEQQLKELIQDHAQRTDSPKAKLILANWSEYLPKFWQVVPPSEANNPEANPTVDSKEERELSAVK
ncbi:glutamate synthase large subunit [Limnofasciculus baicalensis]|uniref:glutamate synthase (ferredoxin) n=1 Tax=Limnofasciculus baicalensis BBK-W-15 TaxID=2699891 RepID=A0AAE3GSK8_9CYAN|nr:glutamate synthase large subunit [Limnofasciculus baicalensis]MCP2729940.1 glutamate synthase large subunit [Limnofasciculus baicalensis BBK-W-15]